MMPDKSSKKIEKLFFSCIFLSFFIGTILVYAFKFNGPPIRSDGVGYYAYLPSVFIYQDISMNKFVDVYTHQNKDSGLAKSNGLSRVEGSSKYLDKYPMGMAAMMTPFFLLGHGATLVAHSFYPDIKSDGFSSPFYHFFIALGSSFYMLLGLILLKKILEPFFKQKTIYITILFLVFATNLFHYATYDSVFSHAYSFFLFTAFMLLTQKWFNKPSAKHAVLLGIVAGFIVFVRPTNALIFLFFPLFGIQFGSFKNFFNRQLQLFWKYKLHIVCMVLIASTIFSPQLFYWKYISKHWLVFSYAGESFNFEHPQIWNVLFSVNKGLFFWAPILLFSIPGLLIMRKKENLQTYIFPLVVYMGCTIYLIASWWWWSYGGCFGHRGFIESMVVLAFPLAAFYENVLEHPSLAFKRIVFTGSTFLLMLTMYMMVQYWRGYLPYDGTTWEIYVAALKNIDIVQQ